MMSIADMALKPPRRDRRSNDIQDRGGIGDTRPRRGARRAIGPLRSRLFDLTWAFWTALFAPVTTVLWLAGAPPRTVRKVSRIWAHGVLFQLAWIVGLDYRERGRVNVSDEPCLIICNHQSIWETLAALVLFPEVSIVAKRELLRIPVLGWFLRRSPMIIIDRSETATAVRKMMSAGAAALASGRSVLIFPEGTRKDPSEKIRFKRGVELLYKASVVPLLPVVVDSGHYWGVAGGWKRPGTFSVTHLPAIEAGLSLPEFARRGEQLMQAEQASQSGRHKPVDIRDLGKAKHAAAGAKVQAMKKSVIVEYL